MPRSRRRIRSGLLTTVAAAAVGVALAASLLSGPPPHPSADPLLTASRASTLPGRLHTKGATIRTSTGAVYTIRAISWFGMETATCAPHGLWQISLDEGLARIASMGFNTIRLPFSNECLHQAAPNSIDLGLNPDLAGRAPVQVMDAVVERAKVYGLNVILDRHRPDSAAQSELWYTAEYPESAWIADWRMLAGRYRDDTNVIGVDLHNEPHGSACWGCGDPAVDWRLAAQRGGNAVLAVDPHLLIIVEGTARFGSSYTWWGGALGAAASAPVRLTTKHRLVYSPHEYPSSVYPQSWFTAAGYPRNLPSIWNRTWGYLDERRIAPVLVGEFGTKLETRSDRRWLRTLVRYIGRTGMSFAYWSFNPDSGDTGGIVADDWVTPQAHKLRMLRPILGPSTTVLPQVGTTTTRAPVTTTTPVVTTTASPPWTPTAPGPETPRTSGALTVQWNLQSDWQTGYVAEFQVSASQAVNGWTVSFPNPTATAVVGAWGMRCSVASGVVGCTSDGDWASRIPPGGSIRVGLQVAATRAPTDPALTITSS